jgi:hypothetical protein
MRTWRSKRVGGSVDLPARMGMPRYLFGTLNHAKLLNRLVTAVRTSGHGGGGSQLVETGGRIFFTNMNLCRMCLSKLTLSQIFCQI